MKMSGFSLIEIMIVILILAIVATMALPKILLAPESAYLAEMNMMMGVLARQQARYMHLTGDNKGVTVDDTQETWDRIGMTMPVNSKYTYTCNGNAGHCVAQRTILGTNSAATFNFKTMTWLSCTGALEAASDPSRGCIVADSI